MVRPPDLALPLPASPRAPSAAVLSLLWAALVLVGGGGVWQWTRGCDRAPVRTAAAPRPGWSFEATFTRVNDAGERVRFGAVRDDAEPMAHAAAVQVGERWLSLPSEFEGGSFLQVLVSADGERWLAVEAFDTEAMGDLQFLASDDGGRTFVHRGTLSWPSYAAYPEGVRFDGQRVEVELRVDEAVELVREYWSLRDELVERFFKDDEWGPMLPPGKYVVRSKNGGRSFGRLAPAGS